MSEQGTRPYGRDPEGVVWHDVLVVARPGAPAGAPAGAGGVPGRQGGMRRKAKGRRPVSWRLVAVGTAGVVTFAATLVGMNLVFGSDDAPPTPQALKECDAPGCAAPEVMPSTATPSSSESPLKSPSATPTKRSSGSPSPTAPPTVKPQGSSTPGAPPPAPRVAPVPPEQQQPPTTAPPAGPPVTVSYSGSGNGYWEYRGSYTVTNRSGASLPSWRLGFEPSRHSRLYTLWPLPWRREGGTVVVSGGPLANGASYTVTFLARGRGEPPTGCTLNYRPCAWG
ncbi:hypothetical protein ACGFNU_00780 [Spirillospora sp. NPDC048911]|uniref:hypothetical protein n=1 Tax=Spirillospora sp. NPDC048911 TaxID=3364527 RepID=UPI003712743A